MLVSFFHMIHHPFEEYRGNFFQTGMSKAPKIMSSQENYTTNFFGGWKLDMYQQVFIHHPPQVLPASSLAAWPTPKIWLHEWKDMVLEVRESPPTVGDPWQGLMVGERFDRDVSGLFRLVMFKCIQGRRCVKKSKWVFDLRDSKTIDWFCEKW